MPGITWDGDAYRKILLAILKDSSVSTHIDWDMLAAEISTETATCSTAALKKHISRLRVAARDNQGSAGNAASSAVKTPAGKKAKGDGSVDPSPAPKKGRAKLKPKAEIDSDEEGTPLTQRYRKMKRKTEDSDEEGTPLTKKFRKVLDEEHENIKTEQDEEV